MGVERVDYGDEAEYQQALQQEEDWGRHQYEEQQAAEQEGQRQWEEDQAGQAQAEAEQNDIPF